MKCYWETRQFVIVILTLLWWSGTEPVISEVCLYLMVRTIIYTSMYM